MFSNSFASHCSSEMAYVISLIWFFINPRRFFFHRSIKTCFFFGSTNTDVYKGFSRVWKIFQTADNESYNRCNWLYRVTSTAPCTRPCLRSCSSGVSCTTSRVRTTLARFQRARPSATADCNSLILLNRLVLIYLNKLRWRVRFHTDYASA